MTYMYWYMCQNVFQTICSQFKKMPTLCTLSPGAGAEAAPKQAGSETLLSSFHFIILFRNRLLFIFFFFHFPFFKVFSFLTQLLFPTSNACLNVQCSINGTRKLTLKKNEFFGTRNFAIFYKALVKFPHQRNCRNLISLTPSMLVNYGFYCILSFKLALSSLANQQFTYNFD